MHCPIYIKCTSEKTEFDYGLRIIRKEDVKFIDGNLKRKPAGHCFSLCFKAKFIECSTRKGIAVFTNKIKGTET